MAKANPIALQKALKGADYPAAKDDLVSRAKKNGADKGLVDQLAKMRSEHYNTPAEVQHEVFK